MKIDLVYLWVDGSDEKWLAKKNIELAKANKPPVKSGVKVSRWRDNDELLYSLRSVEKFAPWINHIFIVTDEQCPKWLNVKNPKITVVDHKQIIPEDMLPLFNASALEIFLWNIPGLSEHFLFANDDMFFGNTVEPSFFFDETGNPIVIFKGRHYINIRRRQTQWNSLQVIRKHFGIEYNLAPKHAIEPYRRSYVQESAQKYYDEIILPSVTPFRTEDNVKRTAFPLIDNALGRNTITMNWRVSKKRIVYDHKIETTTRMVCRKLLWFFATIFGFIKYDSFDKKTFIVTFLKLYRPKLFCINDYGSFEGKAKFLKKMFPEKSVFEL